MAVSEADLIKGCAAKDRYYQKLLYEQHARKMLSICLMYTGDTYEAENVLQEAFVKIFENLRNYKPTGSLGGWIRRIVVNTATDYYRKKKRIKMKYIEVDLELANNQGEIDLDKFGTDRIIKAIRELPEGTRMVFTLFAIEGYTHKEIAETLGISTGTSKSQFFRARALLQQKLKKDELREPKGFLQFK